MGNLGKNFKSFKNEYSNRNTTVERKVELLKLMKEYLIEKNNGQSTYNFRKTNVGTSISIDDCSDPSCLYEIFGDMSASTSSDKLSKNADEERRRQTSQNKYSKDSPYPYE